MTGWTRVGWMAVLLPTMVWAQEAPDERVRTLPAEDRPLTVEVSEVYRAGGLDAPPWAEFGRIRDVAFGPDGTLYILDQQASQVHAVDRDGRYAGPVGSEGQGPGEYQLPTGLTVGPEGDVLVRDTRNGSYVLFRDGVYVDNVRPDGSLGRVSEVALGPGGWLVGRPSLIMASRQGSAAVEASYLVEGGGTVDGVTHLPLVRVHMQRGDPEVVDELWIAPRGTDGGSAPQLAYWPEMRWAVLPDGSVAVADSTSWSIRVRRAHLGEANLRLVRPLPPIPTTDRIREAELERRAEEPGRGGGGAVAFGGTEEERSEALARARERMLEATVRFWPEIQAIQGLRADPAGRLWVARAARDSDDPSVGGPIDLIGADGTYLGTIQGMTLPDAFGPDGLAVWVEEGEMEVPIVVVRRVTPGG